MRWIRIKTQTPHSLHNYSSSGRQALFKKYGCIVDTAKVRKTISIGVTGPWMGICAVRLRDVSHRSARFCKNYSVPALRERVFTNSQEAVFTPKFHLRSVGEVPQMIKSLPHTSATALQLLSRVFVVCLCGLFASTAQAQLNESLNGSPFQVQGNDSTIDQSGDQFSPARLQEYERQLNAVLKTRRNEERQFVKLLVAQIGTGAVSTELVQTSFKWVRKKRPNTSFPFLYFERVLRIIATQQGVAANIPPYDTSVIGQPNPSNQDSNSTATNQAAGILTR